MEQRHEQMVHLAAASILLLGCVLILQPFLTAMLLAAVVCISTWPIYAGLLRLMKGRKNIAALTMTFSLALVLILPLGLVAYNLADNVTAFFDGITIALDKGHIAPPVWLENLPIVGEKISAYWQLISSNPAEMNALINRLLEPGKNLLLAGGAVLGRGVMEMSLAVFVSFFFYRDGVVLVRTLNLALDRMAGSNAANILSIIASTVNSVMYGLLGTGLAQGIVAIIGFTIAGVPAAILLGIITVMLSLIPIGPPLIWGGVSIWLFYQGTIGWGIFMLLWGFFLISSVDDMVKPLLISRGSNLPFMLVLFGVMGGMLLFGFVGVFIGPTLLAVGYRLLNEWIERNKKIAE